MASAFIYANANKQLTLDFNKFIMICAVLITLSVIMSLSEYNVLGKITFYAKGSYANRSLRYIFFIKKSLQNNIFMALFFTLIFSNRITMDFAFNTWKILFMFPFSVFLSLAVMVLRNNDRKTGKRENRMHINPVIKSTLCDYKDSVLTAVIITAVSLFIGITLFGSKDNILNEMTDTVFIPLILFILLSIGFIGLFDSAANTNWLFYAVVSLDFRYHFKRMLIFILSFYGIVLLQYIITVMYIDVRQLFTYLLAIISTMLFATGIAYSGGNNLKKTIVYALYIWLVVYLLYISLLFVRPYIMLASVFPAVIALFVAKNDFIKRGYL
jgi:hypothetical protein